MPFFDIFQDFLGLGTGLGPGWYTGSSVCLTHSSSPSIQVIPILGGTVHPQLWWMPFLLVPFTRLFDSLQLGYLVLVVVGPPYPPGDWLSLLLMRLY